MKVAVISVKVVEGAVDEVVDVVPVRDGGVPAAGVVFCSTLDGCTGGGPTAIHVEDVLRDAGGAGRVEVPVMEIIRVIAMTNGPMTAARPVFVGVIVPVLQGVPSSSNGRIVRFGSRGQAGAEPAR